MCDRFSYGGTIGTLVVHRYIQVFHVLNCYACYAMELTENSRQPEVLMLERIKGCMFCSFCCFDIVFVADDDDKTSPIHIPPFINNIDIQVYIFL